MEFDLFDGEFGIKGDILAFAFFKDEVEDFVEGNINKGAFNKINMFAIVYKRHIFEGACGEDKVG